MGKSRRSGGGNGGILLLLAIVVGLVGVGIGVGALLKRPTYKVQTINYANETIDGCPDQININRKDWKAAAGIFETKCAIYKLPLKAPEGHVMRVYNHHEACSFLQHQDRFGDTTPPGPRRSPSSAEFWHIKLQEHGSSVALRWVTDNHGWTVIEESNVDVQSLSPSPDDYLHTIVTVRDVDGNPSDARDFLATVGINPGRPHEYGRIVNIALTPSDPQDLVQAPEVHHGHCEIIDGRKICVLPSLENANSKISFFDCTVENACVPAQYVPHADAAAINASSFHTVHYDHALRKFLISSLGGANVNGTGPAGYVTVSANVGGWSDTKPVIERWATINATGPNSLGEPNSDAYHYDFTKDACNDLIYRTSWGFPNAFHPGFSFSSAYGRQICVDKEIAPYGKTSAKATENLENVACFTVDPPPSLGGPPGGESIVPLEVRRSFVPGERFAYVGLTLPGAVTSIFFNETANVFQKHTAIGPDQLAADALSPLITNQDGNDPKLGNTSVGFVSDLTWCDDGNTLFVSLWLGGKVLRYDTSDKFNPVLTGGMAGLGGVTTINPGTNVFNPNAYEFAPGQYFTGGSQMLRVNRACTYLVDSSSLYGFWDDQLYPPGVGSIKTNGASQIMLRTGVSKGKHSSPMSIDTSFGVNGVLQYKNLRHPEVSGPFSGRAHEGHILGVRHS